MKIAFLIALFSLLLVLAVPLYFDQTEKQSSYFKTYLELQDSELIDKGWVPSFIPDSAYDIYEKHRVDVSSVNVKFRFSPSDTMKIKASCERQISNSPSETMYKCRHGNNMVSVKLSEDGRGEIFSD